VGNSWAALNVLKRTGRMLPPARETDGASEPARDGGSTAPAESPGGRVPDPDGWLMHRWPRFDARARREIILGLALLFCYGFFRQAPAWNEFSRYDLVRALVEDGTTRIDRFEQNTGDKAFYDGHYYSDKAPGTAFMGVPVYLLLTFAWGAAGAGTPDPLTAVQVLAFFESGIPTVLLVLLLLRFLRPAVGERWALVISLGYGLGSIAFPFATMFFGHAASAFFLFAAFYVLWRSRELERPGLLPALAGFLAGWAVLVDLTAILGAVALLVYAPGSSRPTVVRPRGVDWRTPALMAAGATLPAAMLLGYNWVSFGGPFSLGYTNLAPGGFAEGMGRGILGVTWPRVEVLGDLLFGPRGLVHLAPWFIVAPLGLVAARGRGLRREVLVCGAIVVAFLAFNAGYYMPFGGWTPGPRFLLPALPFAAVLVALAPRGSRLVVVFLTAVSVAILFVATVTMPNAPEAYRDPLAQLWLPRLLSRDLADSIAWQRWGLHGTEPLLVLVLTLALAATALVATLRSGAAASRLSGVLAGVLAVLIAAFALPFPTPPASALAPGGSSSPSVGSIAIVDVGATPVLTVDEEKSAIWAQLENRGPAIGDTRVVFTVVTMDGRPTWSAWHDNVFWREGERRRLEVGWETKGVPHGDYRVEVTVASTDLKTVYARASNPDVVRVGH
jgi:hypothetical protein